GVGPEAERMGSVRVVLGDVEEVGGVERVPLRVQRVAGVFDERNQVLREEGDVVEASMGLVAVVEDRNRAHVARRRLDQLEDRREAAGDVRRRTCRAARMGGVGGGRFGLGAGPPPAHVRLSVSPVSSKYSSLNLEPGRNARFSGRLNGVAPAVLASALASAPGNGVVAVVVLMSIHLVGNVLPYWWSDTYPAELAPEMSVFAAAAMSAADELAGCVNFSGLPPTIT